MGYEHLATVLHTGLQTLAILGVGWATARWQLLQSAGTNAQVVSLLNILIMRVCLPALQLLLLAVQTDMRHLHNWRMLAAFMLWTAVIQMAAGVWVLLVEDGRLDRWGAHALVLVANNTGVLAPVVLDAALGEGVGYIGMLATVCLYFQQLPVSEALMAAGQLDTPPPLDVKANDGYELALPAVVTIGGGLRRDVWSEPRFQVVTGQSPRKLPSAFDYPQDLTPTAATQPVDPFQGSPEHQRQPSPDRLFHISPTRPGAAQGTGMGQRRNAQSSAIDLGDACHRVNVRADTQRPPWQHGSPPDWGPGSQATREEQSSVEAAPSLPHVMAPDTGLGWVRLLLRNPLVWTTGLAAFLSTAGSAELLAQGGKHSIKQLAFISGSLEWLARCSVPLTLMSTGVWLHGRTQLLTSANSRLVATYLVLKLFVLPWLMVGITHIMGIGGRHGMALLLLTVVPVGQTAFVLSERYHCCTEAITATLIAGLLLLLPHLLLVIWVREQLRLYPEG